MGMAGDPVAELRAKIHTYLTQSGLTFEQHPDGSFGVRYGSTKALVIPAQWTETHTIVKLLAPVSLECKRFEPALGMFLAEENARLLFGKFSIDKERNAVWYEHALLGNSLDADELIMGIATIVKTADDYDERVCGMTGGRRVADV